ncbi:hypothetical protein E3N88_09722 [Mikania micrantha]|uniref:Uncharacterized protein n=1 Tax=Mikania micrantha TaxID=192012 RepID=A0A5N6PM48_9ASTR|nr:hypothetical protein E3N88_09722 [Mikania micrantha]
MLRSQENEWICGGDDGADGGDDDEGHRGEGRQSKGRLGLVNRTCVLLDSNSRMMRSKSKWVKNFKLELPIKSLSGVDSISKGQSIISAPLVIAFLYAKLAQPDLMAKQIKKTQSLTIECNKYEKERQLIEDTREKKRLSDLGVKNIVKSLTSLAESQQTKQKTVKRNSHARDIDYIPSAEDDSEDDDQQVGSRVDMEVDDVDQDDGDEDIDSGIGGRLHSDSYETGSQHESSDDDESTVGRRGPVAPTPLPEPRNHSVIKGRQPVLLGKLCRLSGPISRRVGKISLKRMKIGCLTVSRARNSAKKAACNANVEVGDDLSVIIPYKPRRMGSLIWEKLVEYWNTDDWKAKSSINASNRGKLIAGKHTLGSQTYATLKRKADKLLGRHATVVEIWMQSHGKKGTRPLDKLLISKGGERSQEAGNLDEIDLQTTVKWVDTRAKDSLKSYKECVKKRYGVDASKQPLFDPDSWIQAVGGRKKGRVYDFSDISDPYVVMTGTSSTATNEEV